MLPHSQNVNKKVALSPENRLHCSLGVYVNIGKWMREREEAGTLADVARRILEGERTYMETERTLRALCSLEATVREGGNQQAASRLVGLSIHTIQRDMRSLGMDAATLKKLSFRMKVAAPK